MGAPCALYLKLEARFVELRAKLLATQLAAEVSDPMSFTPDLDFLAAFRLLVHAEFEEFLELKARDNLNLIGQSANQAGYSLWSKTDIFVLSLLLSRPLIIENPFDRAGFSSQIQALLKCATDWVADNNGIKAPSFYQLSVFAGKTVEELDHTLAASLTSYGKSRGDVAHKSVTRVATLLAPSAEEKAALDILTGLKIYFYGP